MKDEKRNATGRLKSLWLLFINMLKIGLFTFGGGYAMIHLLENEFVSKKKWIEEDEFMDLVAIAESTPGPIAINCSTYIGYKKEKILGAVLATLGMCIPSFTIILLVATLLTKLLKYAGVKAVLGGIKPAIVGMILATALTMFLSVILNIRAVQSAVIFDWKGLVIFGVLLAVALAYFKWKKKAFSPILLIVISGVLGVLMYGI